MFSQNIWKWVVGNILINFSPSIFLLRLSLKDFIKITMLLLAAASIDADSCGTWQSQ